MVKRIKSSALLCGATSNNCFTVYQKELSLLLIQEVPTIAFIVFGTDPENYLMRVKEGTG